MIASCELCGDTFDTLDSDAIDNDLYCSEACEYSDNGASLPEDDFDALFDLWPGDDD